MIISRKQCKQWKKYSLQVSGLVMFPAGEKQDLEWSYFEDRGLEATKRLHIS